ncbi:MAG: DUF1150 family protein [Rhodobacteraceae bacterium]|nr:DUF1150 family protein [Paracoccaceae bacterium]
MNTSAEPETIARPIVYVKKVDVVELPKEVRDHAGDLEQIYAVHDANGQRLALVSNRAMAFVLARRHDLSPVAVH